MPFAEPQNMTNVMDIFRYSNSVTNNIFGIGAAISLYMCVLLYLHYKGNDISDCSIVAGFITTISITFLRMGGIIDNYALFISVIVFVLSLVWGIFSKD
jgi:hypothetical protein